MNAVNLDFVLKLSFLYVTHVHFWGKNDEHTLIIAIGHSMSNKQ